MPHVHRDFTVYDLTAQMEDGRYMARAAVVGRRESRTLSQHFLDFETFESKAEATARAQAGARAWIDEEMWYAPLALPTNYAGRFMSEKEAESAATSGSKTPPLRVELASRIKDLRAGRRRSGPCRSSGAMPKVLNLTASKKVVRAHQGRRHVTIADTRRAVQEAALRVADGTAGLESISLAAMLEKMTGVSISELAVHAEDWPDA